jgi:leucyl-tRNA synthetase
VDIYIGGDEHNTLHLLYSRFIYQFLWDIGAVPQECPEPYYRRISHGVILGPDGQRMSKSRGNVINPDDMWEKYGVDALRTYLMFMGPFEGTIVWNERALKGVVRFLEKFKKLVEQSIVKSQKSEVKEKQVMIALNKLIKKVSEDIDKLQFNTAIAAMMEFLNKIENEKLKIKNEEAKILIQLLAPFAPYLSEELWHKLNSKFNPPADGQNAKLLGSVHAAPWPKPDPKFLVEEEVEIIVQVNGKLRGTIKIKNSKCKIKNYVEEVAKEEPKVAKYLAGKEILKTIFVPGRLVNFVVK